MAAFSEVWRLGQGQIGVGGYTFFWSGPVRTLTHGLTIAVSDWLLLAMDNIRRISDRLMSLRLRHSIGALTVVTVYTSTNVGTKATKIASTNS